MFRSIDEWWSHQCGTAWTVPLDGHISGRCETGIKAKSTWERALLHFKEGVPDIKIISPTIYRQTYYPNLFIPLILFFLFTCKANLFITQQAEDAVIQLHVPAVVLIHLSQYTHQFCPSLGGMGALALMCWQLMEWTLPRTANPLVLTLSYPDDIIISLS